MKNAAPGAAVGTCSASDESATSILALKPNKCTYAANPSCTY